MKRNHAIPFVSCWWIDVISHDIVSIPGILLRGKAAFDVIFKIGPLRRKRLALFFLLICADPDKGCKSQTRPYDCPTSSLAFLMARVAVPAHDMTVTGSCCSVTHGNAVVVLTTVGIVVIPIPQTTALEHR